MCNLVDSVQRNCNLVKANMHYLHTQRPLAQYHCHYSQMCLLIHLFTDLFATWMSADCVNFFQTGMSRWTMWSWTSRRCWNWEKRRQTPPKSSAIQWTWMRWELETGARLLVSKFLTHHPLLKLKPFLTFFFPPSAGPQTTTTCHRKAVSFPPSLFTLIQNTSVEVLQRL